MLSLAICMTPVTTPNLRFSLPFRADERKSLRKSSTSLCIDDSYDRFRGLSYSSIRMIVFLP